MGLELRAGWGAVVVGLAVGASVVGLARAQVNAVPLTTPLPPPGHSTHQTYEVAQGRGEVVVDTSPGYVKVQRDDGEAAQVTTAPGGGLMVDLGVMRSQLVANREWEPMTGGSDTVVRVPMDLKTLRVTIPVNSQPMILNGAIFKDQRGHQLEIITSALPGPI